MRYLRTNTAIAVTVGPFLSSSDGVTPNTSITATNAHVTLSVDVSDVPTLELNASATASGGTNNLVHVTGDVSGLYSLTLSAAQLNFVGRAMLVITDSTDAVCPVVQEFELLPASVYDSLVNGTANLAANAVAWAGTAITATSLPVATAAGASGGLLTFGTGAGQINVDGAGNASANVAKVLGTASAGAAGYVGIDWGHVNAPTSTVGLSGTTVGTLTTYTGNTPQTGDSFARLGVPSGASIDADILSRLASSGYTAPPTAAAIATSVWTDTTAGDFTTASSPGKVVLSQLGGAFTTSSSSVLSTASLVNAPVTSAAPTAAAVATAVWTDLTSTSDFSTAGSAGAFIKGSIAQSGDSFVRIGSTGSGLTSLAPASTALNTAQWTGARAANLDNLDAAVSTRSTYAGGAVASVTGSVGSIAGVTFPTHFSSLVIDTLGRIDLGHVLGAASAGAPGYVGLDWGQVANLTATNNLSNTTISTGQTIQTVTGNVAGNVGGISGAVTVGVNQDKTGYSLASTGLDSISVSAPTGVASTFPGMLIQIWRRFFKASAKSAANSTITTFADDGRTVVTTQRYTDDGAGTETLSGSS